MAVSGGAGALVGMAPSALAGDDPRGHYRQEYLDGVREFCADDGYLSESHGTVAAIEEGFHSADAAIEAAEEEYRSAAASTLAALSVTRAPQELVSARELLEPARSFATTARSTVSGGTVVYADLPAEGRQEILEARLVAVQFENGLWDVLSTTRCESTIAADIGELRSLLGVEN